MGIEKYFETSATPHLIVNEIHGNMQLRVWDEARVMVTGNGSSYNFRQEGDEIHLGDFDDCRIFVPVATSVTLEQVHGNAHISGVRGQLQVNQIHGNLNAETLGTVRLERVDGDTNLRGLAGPLQIERVRGNLNAGEVKGDLQVGVVDGNCNVREIEGKVTVTRVRGNFNLNESYDVSVEGVSGNFNVKAVQGSVRGDKIGGNVSATEIMGDLNVDHVGGELKIREVMGGINARVGGNAKLDLQELAIPFVSVHAGGDIRCRVPIALDARLEMRAGNDITIKNLSLPNQWNARQADFTVGNGEGHLELRAGNRIKLIGTDGEEVGTEWEPEMDFQFQGDFNVRAADLVQQVADQVEAQVEAFTRTLNERLSQLDNGDAIASKVQVKVQSAMRQAEEKIADAMRRAERQAERHAERQAARDARFRTRGVPPMPPMPPGVPGTPGVPGVPPMSHVHMPPPPVPPTPAKPKRNPPSPEERMMVLKMLEEGKISVEQAEKLLAAMGE